MIVRPAAAFGAAIAISVAVYAEPVVLYDTGSTRPLAPLAEASGLALEAPDDIVGPSPERPPTGPFPVVSATLKPGPVGRMPTGERGRTMPAPLFLVGDDARSRAWLAAHRNRLRALRATGLLVSVADEHSYREMLAIAAGIPLAPAPGDEVAGLLGISHYPVLIGPEWIEQ